MLALECEIKHTGERNKKNNPRINVGGAAPPRLQGWRGKCPCCPPPCSRVYACKQVGNLGVIFDGTLSWDAHVSELSRWCTGLLIGLSHVRHYLPDGVTKTLVVALVMSRIQYCLSVFGNGSQKNFDRIQKMLNFALESFLVAVNLIMNPIFGTNSAG